MPFSEEFMSRDKWSTHGFLTKVDWSDAHCNAKSHLRRMYKMSNREIALEQIVINPTATLWSGCGFDRTTLIFLSFRLFDGSL